MARIDYYGIEKEIETILKNDEGLSGVSIHVEEEVILEEGPTVCIYLDRRTAPAEIQSISAGQRTRQEIMVELWCYHFALEKPEALRLRDDLLGRVEIALMRKPSLNGKVTHATIVGGEFDSLLKGGDRDSFRAGASIQLLVDTTGTIS